MRCSASARHQAVEPAGTAGTYDGIVLAEWPLPWPRDVGAIPALTRRHHRAQAAYGGRWRLQAIVPVPATGGSPRASESGTDSASGTNSTGPGPVDSTEVLWETGDVRLYRRPPGAFSGFEPVDAGTADREVLVCTHGSRDRCCGSLGAAMFNKLPTIPGVRFRRTSHTGGHRFAPTALILPEGTSWAYLDEESLTAIVARTAPLDEAARHYRGCFGLDGPELQVADREALLRHGWAWLDAPRSGSVVARDGDRIGVRIEAPGIAHEVELKIHWSAPVVRSCGTPLESAAKNESQWEVVAFG
ncbi:sucrase ferredoxin [Frankia gtarii]|uniref:sucrase ferredoxin n=1 Tax=Frankia gtarii TaxID=2950102 RepID=UPI0021BF938B|nr:sucrase ferredoxin [Frankia gtarii]